MRKIAFYIMNSKGFYVLSHFINKFSPDSIEYIVCAEDKNIQKDFYNEIKSLAKEQDIKFFNRLENDSTTEKSFTGYKFAIGWRWIIKEEKKLIVFHDSILPRYRGFAPLVNCLINNEKNVGVTALYASNEYDKGDIISQRILDVCYPIKINELISKIEPLYFELIEEIYLNIQYNKLIKSNTQDESEATYSLWLDDKDYFIDWSWSAEKIKRFIDAVGYPYDNAKAYLNGNIVKFIDVKIINDVFVENRVRHIGKVIFIMDTVPVIVCRYGLIGLIDIRDENNNEVHVNFRSRFQ